MSDADRGLPPIAGTSRLTKAFNYLALGARSYRERQAQDLASVTDLRAGSRYPNADLVDASGPPRCLLLGYLRAAQPLDL